MPVRGRGAWFQIREGDQSWEFTTEGRGLEVRGGLGMRLRGQGAWFRIREGGPSWELIIEGRGSEVEGGAGHVFEAARSFVSDLRGMSELGIHHRG